MMDARAELEMLRKRKRLADLEAKAGGGASAPAMMGGVSTRQDSAARGLPPLTMPNFWGQELPARWKAPPLSKQWQDVKDTASGIPTGVAAGIGGIPGNIEAVGRAGLSAVSNISPQTTLPTSSQMGNLIAGPPANAQVAGGRDIGSLLSPFAAVKTAQGGSKVAGAVAKPVLGATTGAGSTAIGEAYQAGKAGGAIGEAFRSNMRAGADKSDEVVQMAKDAVDQLKRERSAAYQAGIGSTIKGDPAVLDFAPVEAAITKASGIASYKGKSLSSGADKVWKKIEEVVAEWKQQNPVEFHTAEGLDALKKKLGNLAYEEDLSALTKPGSPGKAIVDRVYNAVKGQIVQQAPGYSRVMKDYMDASEELRQIEGSMSLGNKALADTSLRKLQSIMRNNANTNYGQRLKAGERLNEAGGGELMPALAGQMLNSPMPRALQGVASTGVGLGMAATGGLPGVASALPALALTSPRLVGEGAHALGRVAGALSPAVQKAGIVPGGGANVANALGLDPRIIGLLPPQILAQLLAQQTTTAP